MISPALPYCSSTIRWTIQRKLKEKPFIGFLNHKLQTSISKILSTRLGFG